MLYSCLCLSQYLFYVYLHMFVKHPRVIVNISVFIITCQKVNVTLIE